MRRADYGYGNYDGGYGGGRSGSRGKGTKKKQLQLCIIRA